MNNSLLYDNFYAYGGVFFNKLKLFDAYIVCHPVNFNSLSVAMESLETVKTALWKIAIIANLKA